MKKGLIKTTSLTLALGMSIACFASCAKADGNAIPAPSTEATAASSAVPSETSSADSRSETKVTYTIDNIRGFIVGVDDPVELPDGSKKVMVNFDNAATTPALKPVMEEVDSKLKTYGSIGRGFSAKSNISTEIYENTRDKVLSFVNCSYPEYTCVYVNSTTDGLNKLASALITSKNDIVLATRMEHHSNDLSWRNRCKVIYADVDDQGRIKYDEIEKLLKKNKVKYVTVTAASNVTGYVTDVHRIAKMAHKYGAKIIVDGAQIVAHRSFSMTGNTPDENIDFFVFSAHKMYSPYGGGAIVGLTDELGKHMPKFYGGGIVDIVTDNTVTYTDAPHLYEAGSPNYPGVVGLGKSIDVLNEVGFESISAHEQKLMKKMIDGLKQRKNVVIYGDIDDISDRVGVITFKFTDINSALLATKLANAGAGTRRGAFCAHPYVWRLMGVSNEQARIYEGCDSAKTPGMIRVSFGIYNTEEEVDEFLRLLDQTLENYRNTNHEGTDEEDFDPAF